MGSKPHPDTGQTISYYDVRFAKITVFNSGEVYGQRFDLTGQSEGKWIVLKDAQGNFMPIKVCRQGNDVLVEWLQGNSGYEPPLLNNPPQSTPTSSVKWLRRKTLEQQLASLEEEYTAINQQFNSTLDAGDRLRLNRKLEHLAREMQRIEDDLNNL